MDIPIHQSNVSEDLNILAQKLQSFFDDLPVNVQCAVRDERLIVLGQHPKNIPFDPAHLLKFLERKIQSFHLDFTKQVRLYLRVIGEIQPYAHRWFMIQPPPPPLLRSVQVDCDPAFVISDKTGVSGHEEKEHWVIQENELDELVFQLTSSHPLDGPKSDESESLALASLPTLRHAKHGSEHGLTVVIEQTCPSEQEAEIGGPDEEQDPASRTLNLLPWDEGGELTFVDINNQPDQVIDNDSSHRESIRQHFKNYIQLVSRTLFNRLSGRKSAIFLPSQFDKLNDRFILVSGAAFVGVAGTVYGLTRPCVIGECSRLTKAQDLENASSQIIQKADSWNELQIARDRLVSAIELLEPVPGWSHHSQKTNQLKSTFTDRLIEIEALLDMEELAHTASQVNHSEIFSLAEWKNIQSLWNDVITTLDTIPATSNFYPLALNYIGTYRDRLAHVEQRIQREQDATHVLDNAKQAAQLAKNRQMTAQSLEHWRFARVTWIVAIERLEAVPQNTMAWIESRRLLESYQSSLEVIERKVQREQVSVRKLEQAEQRAQIAQAAEQRLDWQQAIQDWDKAIVFAQQVETGSDYQIEAEELVAHYTQALIQAKDKLSITEQIEMELESKCLGEIRICNLLSVGQTVKVRLDSDYLNAISAARSSGNEQIQAVVTDHQLILRRTLEQFAQDYRLAVEVYDDADKLLERHTP